LRLEDSDLFAERKVELPAIRARRERHFLPALPEALFGRLAAMPGKCLAVYLILLQRSRMERENPIALTSARLTRSGLTRKHKQRALCDLESAGLIRVEKRKRKNPLVHLLEENAHHDRKRP
jgi:hypothetical protein